MLPQLAGIGAGDKAGIDGLHLLDAAHRAHEAHAALAVDRALPAALDLVGHAVEPVGNALGQRRTAFGIVDRLGIERADNRRLLDHRAVIARVEPLDGMHEIARLLGDRQQIAAGMGEALAGRQNGIFGAGGQQIVLQRPLVLEILLGTARA